MKYTGNNNFSSVVTRGALSQPHKEVITYGQHRVTFASLQERVSALSQGLLDLGVKRGDVVGILLYNHPEFLEIIFAVNRIGAIFLPINYRLAVAETVYILQDSGAKAILSETSFHETLESIRGGLGELQYYISLSPNQPNGWIHYEQLIETNRGADIQDTHVELNDLHRLMYTSGTTSRPKGVMITYENLYWKNIAHIWEFNITPEDKTLITGPMYHVGGLDLTATGTLYRGGSVVIINRFNTLEVLQTIQRENPTNVWLAPSMVNMILQDPNVDKYELGSIRYIVAGGERMPEPLVQKVNQIFKNAWFCDAYGLTETVSGDTFLPHSMTIAKLGSVGRPCLHLDMKIVNDQGDEVPQGEVGEIVFRGPKVSIGYWKNPEATEKAFKNGWYFTGDMGNLDPDGFLYIIDRKKDMIISGGENIASLEVERVLYEHPAVLEATVIGVPDDRWGEVPKAYVVIKPGHHLSEAELQDHCLKKLAKFKVPKEVEFIDKLPRNPSGKVLKRVLRADRRSDT